MPPDYISWIIKAGAATWTTMKAASTILELRKQLKDIQKEQEEKAKEKKELQESTKK